MNLQDARCYNKDNPQNRLDKSGNLSRLADHFLTWKERNATYFAELVAYRLPVMLCLVRNEKSDQSRSTVIQKFKKMLGVVKSCVTWILKKWDEMARNRSI